MLQCPVDRGAHAPPHDRFFSHCYYTGLYAIAGLLAGTVDEKCGHAILGLFTEWDWSSAETLFLLCVSVPFCKLFNYKYILSALKSTSPYTSK